MGYIGFRRLASDGCVFQRGDIWFITYVDGIIWMDSDEMSLNKVKYRIRNFVDMKDKGSLRSFLGVLIAFDNGGTWLSQKHYIY